MEHAGHIEDERLDALEGSAVVSWEVASEWKADNKGGIP